MVTEDESESLRFVSQQVGGDVKGFRHQDHNPWDRPHSSIPMYVLKHTRPTEIKESKSGLVVHLFKCG